MSTTDTTTDPDAGYEPRLKARYRDEVVPALKDRLGVDNVMRVPTIDKIVVNVGLGEAVDDAKALEGAIRDLATITGQQPKVNRARKSVAGFKLRQGMPIGVSVTLRGERMWEFADRLMSIALPRVRDFRGLNPRSFDGAGNFTFGLTEQLVFPEIDYDDVDDVRGMDITFVTTAREDEGGRALLEELGMPFARQS